MPFKPPAQAKCPLCGKSVYAAEEKIAAGQKWHKFCFKCGICNIFYHVMMRLQHTLAQKNAVTVLEISNPECTGLCNMLLDSTTCAEHEGMIYCKGCHGKKFGPKGYGFGQGAGALSMETGGQFGNEGCEMTNRPTATSIEGGGGANACGRCRRAVYEVERAIGISDPYWHKRCCSCRKCNKSLEVTTLNRHEDEIYCKGCYSKNFGTTGYGFGMGAGCLSTGT